MPNAPVQTTRDRAEAMIEIARVEELLDQACRHAERLEENPELRGAPLSGPIREFLEKLTDLQKKLAAGGDYQS